MGRSNLKIILDTGAANNFAPVSIGTYYKDAKIFQLKNIIRVKTADGTIHEITQGCKIMLPPPFRTTYLVNEFGWKEGQLSQSSLLQDLDDDVQVRLAELDGVNTNVEKHNDLRVRRMAYINLMRQPFQKLASFMKGDWILLFSITVHLPGRPFSIIPQSGYSCQQN